jgi:hypothetical protein
MMAALRRTPRAVYRVYSQEEYLAGADVLTDWDAPPAQASSAQGISRERRLRRLAGAAALTGAMGTVAGAIALASIRAGSADRNIATNDTPRERAELPREAPAGSAGAFRRARAGHQDQPPRVGALARRSAAGDRSVIRRHAVAANAARSASPWRLAASAPTAHADPAWRRPAVVSGPAQSAPARLARPAQGTPVEAAAAPPMQSEFGFER